MLDIDALFAEGTPADAVTAPRKADKMLSPVNVHMQTVPTCPNLGGINGTASVIHKPETWLLNKDIKQLSHLSQGVPRVCAGQRWGESDKPQGSTIPDAREGLQSEYFRAPKPEGADNWQADERDRNEAAFMVCCVFNRPDDTETDRQEAYRWALTTRGAFDWLNRRNGHPAFSTDDNRRPCACCANRNPCSGRCSAADRCEITALRPYYPNAFLLQRCTAFVPMAGDPDRRPGVLRWPGLLRLVAMAGKGE